MCGPGFYESIPEMSIPIGHEANAPNQLMRCFPMQRILNGSHNPPNKHRHLKRKNRAAPPDPPADLCHRKSVEAPSARQMRTVRAFGSTIQTLSAPASKVILRFSRECLGAYWMGDSTSIATSGAPCSQFSRRLPEQGPPTSGKTNGVGVFGKDAPAVHADHALPEAFPSTRQGTETICLASVHAPTRFPDRAPPCPEPVPRHSHRPSPRYGSTLPGS